MSQFPLLTSCQILLEQNGNVPADVLVSKLGNLPNDEIIMNYLVLVGAVYRKTIRRFKDSQWKPVPVESVNLRKRTITFADGEIRVEDLPIEPEMMQVYVRACLQIGVYEPPVEFFLLFRDDRDKDLATRRANAFIEYLLRRDWEPNEHSTNSSQCIRNKNVFRRISLGKGRVQPVGREGGKTRQELLEESFLLGSFLKLSIKEEPIDIADYRIISHPFFQHVEDWKKVFEPLFRKDNFDRPVVEAFTKNEFLVSWFRANLRTSFITTTTHTKTDLSSAAVAMISGDDALFAPDAGYTVITPNYRFSASTQRYVEKVVTQSNKKDGTYFATIENADDRICGLLALLQSYQNLVLPTAKFFRSGDDALVEQPFDVIQGFGQQHRFHNQNLKTVVDTNGFTVVKNQLGKSFGEPLRKVDFHELTFTFRGTWTSTREFPPQPSYGSSGIMHTASSLESYIPYDFLLQHGVTTLFENIPRDTLQLLKMYRSYIITTVPFNKDQQRWRNDEDQFFHNCFTIIMSFLKEFNVGVNEQLQFKTFAESFTNFKACFSLDGGDYSLGMFYRTAWWNNQVCKLRSLFSIVAWVGDRLHDLLAWIDPEQIVTDRDHYFITPLCSVFLLNDLKQDPKNVYGPLQNVLYEIPGEEYRLKNKECIEKIRDLAQKKKLTSGEGSPIFGWAAVNSPKELNELEDIANELEDIATLFRVKEEPLTDEQLAFLQKILHPAYLKYLILCFPAEYIGKMNVDNLMTGAFTFSHPTDPLWFMRGRDFTGYRSKNILDNVYAMQYITAEDPSLFERSPGLYPMLFNAMKVYSEAIEDPSFENALNFASQMNVLPSSAFSESKESYISKFSGVTVDEAVKDPDKVVEHLNPFHAYTNVDRETAFLDQVTRNIERLRQDGRITLEYLYVYILDPLRQIPNTNPYQKAEISEIKETHDKINFWSRLWGHPYYNEQYVLSKRGFIASTNKKPLNQTSKKCRTIGRNLTNQTYSFDVFDPPNNSIIAIGIPVSSEVYIEHFSTDKNTIPWPALLNSSSIINLYNATMTTTNEYFGFFKPENEAKVGGRINTDATYNTPEPKQLTWPSSFEDITTVKFVVGPPSSVQEGTLHINCDVLKDFTSCELLAEELCTGCLENTTKHVDGIKVFGDGRVASHMAAVFAARAFSHVTKVTLTNPVPSYTWYLESLNGGQDEHPRKLYQMYKRFIQPGMPQHSTTDRLYDYIVGRWLFEVRRYQDAQHGTLTYDEMQSYVEHKILDSKDVFVEINVPEEKIEWFQIEQVLGKTFLLTPEKDMFDTWIKENNFETLAKVQIAQ